VKAIANDISGLSSKLATQLRDTAHAVWNSTEKDDLVGYAIANLYPRFARYIDPSVTAAQITLVADTYFYAVPANVLEVSGLDWIDTDDDELGPLDDQAWQVTGDPFGGTLKVRIAPGIVEQLGTLRVHGYGRFGPLVGTAIALATSAAADDIIDTAAAHGFTLDQTVQFPSLTGGTGLSTATAYYIIAGSLAATTFQVSATPRGTAINFTTDITAGTVARYFLVPDDYVPLVLAQARAEALRRMADDRAKFEVWLARNQKQSVSVNELMQLVNDADIEIERLRQRLPRTWRRPVPGRLG
jgi:hypothetical protein